MCFMLLFRTWCKGAAALGLFDFMKLPVNLHAAAAAAFFFCWLSFINLLAFVLVMSLLLAVSHCTDEYVCNCTLFLQSRGRDSLFSFYHSWTLLCQLAFNPKSVGSLFLPPWRLSFPKRSPAAFVPLNIWFELLVLWFAKNVMIYEQGRDLGMM